MKKLLVLFAILLLTGCQQKLGETDVKISETVMQKKYNQEASEKIKDKYRLENAGLKIAVAENKAEAKIGGDGEEFEPKIKFARWENKASFSAKFKSVEAGEESVRFQGEKIIWAKGDKEVHFYDLGEKETKEEGQIIQAKSWSYEQEVILKEKPLSNVVEFEIESEGLEYREKDNGYEFYKKIPLPSAAGEEEYEEIAFYIEPIIIKDAAGKELKKAVEFINGSLKITIDSDDLANAVYPVSIDPAYTVESGVVYDYATGYNNGRKLARSSNGDLHTAWTDKRGTYYQIYYAKSTDGGETWAETALTSASYDQVIPSIAIDSNDYIHIVWRGTHADSATYNQIRYIKYTTSWQAIENLTSGNYHQYYPSIAIDSTDNVHVVWEGLGWGTYTSQSQIQYRKRTTEWQTQENVTNINNWQSTPSIAIDSTDNVHVVWRFTTNVSNSTIQYRKRTTSWQTQEAITTIANANQYNPSIALDSTDNVHVVWAGLGWGTNTTVNNIQYRKKTTSWQTQEGVTDINYNQNYPSIAIDSNDYIHITWMGLHADSTTYAQIRYRKYTDSWQDIENLTSAGDHQYYPGIIWANYPVVATLRTNRPKNGYALVWTDATGTNSVMFFKSADLDWDAAAGGEDEPDYSTTIINDNTILKDGVIFR